LDENITRQDLVEVPIDNAPLGDGVFQGGAIADAMTPQAVTSESEMLFSGEHSGDDFTLRLPNYAGPLDVLLRLIEERQMEITAVSIATVADQFLHYMANMPSRDPRTLSNFVSVAARLILLKSRALLPQLSNANNDGDDAQDEDDLVQQLRAYQLYKRTARWLGSREAANLRSYSIQPPTVERPRSSQLPLDNVTLELLSRAMQRVVDRWLPPPAVEKVMSRLPFTVNDCITRIETAVADTPRIMFTDILSGVNLRVEIIISLLAVLELLKRNVIVAWQEQLFGDIVIEKAPPLGPEVLDAPATSADDNADEW
jgi:segregation and condensation protein A